MMEMDLHLRRGRLAALAFQSFKYAFSPRPKVTCVSSAPREPLISIIIPTFNWSQVLKFAIHSVLWQTEQDFELLVMGDGCTDDSEAVVKSIPDGRIQWFNLPVNSGHQSAPNNAGLARARGKYIALLGHDDIWHPAHLKSLRSAIEAKGADVASSLIEMIGPAGTNFRMITGLYPKRRYAGEEILPPSGLLMKRSEAVRIGGWKDYRTISRNPDLDFDLRALEVGCRFASTNELTVFKFNSAMRKNSYVEKPCHEQAAYVARIESERWFMLRETMAIARGHWWRRPMVAPAFSPPPNEDAAGWEVTQFRKFRGLE